MRRESFALTVVGLGYVGSTLASVAAYNGFRVYGVDVVLEKVELMNKGVPPVLEPGLNGLLKEALGRGLFKATMDFKEAVGNADLVFITVGTPSMPDGSINLKYVESAARSIGRVLRGDAYRVVVVKSTVVPGTTRCLVKKNLEEESGLKAGRDFGLCMNPEFLREGSAVHDLLNPERVIIGEFDRHSGDVLEAFYREFYRDKPNVPILRVSLETAEMIKYANNAFLATKISFINTIANICEFVPGCDVVEVAKALGLDSRISPRFLDAGLGYGGSCFPKDVKALIAFARDKGYDPFLLRAVEEVNRLQPYRAIKLCKKLLGNLNGRKIAVLGLSFKPNTDDIREAVSLKVIEGLLSEGAKVTVYDPAAMGNVKKVLGSKVEYASSARECIRGADCAIVVTEWDEFKQLKPEDFLNLMRVPALVDGRRVFDPKLFAEKGVKLEAIGLGKAS